MGRGRSSQSMFRMLVLIGVAFAGVTARSQTSGDTEWPNYGNDPGGMRYSPLSQVNRENVSKLKVAWIFHTGDVSDGSHDRKRSGFEATPILVDGTLYLTTPFGRVIALDPETGKQKWAYDPKADVQAGYGDFTNRGVATWVDPVSKKRFLYVATIDARLIAIDAVTGEPAEGFTQVNLKEGLRNKPRFKSEYEE